MPRQRENQPPGGYALTVEAASQRWTWALSHLDARVAARGEAPNRETAWRSGLLAANAIEALGAVARRRF